MRGDTAMRHRIAAGAMYSAVPWIKTVEPDDATGLLKEAYDWQAERLGEPTEFTMLGSLYPEIVMERLRLYRVVEGCPSTLSPGERQLAAYVASMLHHGHCVSAARVKLPTLGVDQPTIDAVTQMLRTSRPGDERLDTILRYAAGCRSNRSPATPADVEALREVGLDDLDIVDLNNIVAYYCYINRVANGLGLLTEIPAEHALSVSQVTLFPSERPPHRDLAVPRDVVDNVRRHARQCEAAGIGDLWVGDEGPGRGPVRAPRGGRDADDALEARVGAHEPLPPPSAITAVAVMTVHELSEGRGVLGLGPGGDAPCSCRSASNEVAPARVP